MSWPADPPESTESRPALGIKTRVAPPRSRPPRSTSRPRPGELQQLAAAGSSERVPQAASIALPRFESSLKYLRAITPGPRSSRSCSRSGRLPCFAHLVDARGVPARGRAAP